MAESPAAQGQCPQCGATENLGVRCAHPDCPNRSAAQTYECPDCGSSLADEVGVQECECGRVVETYATAAEIPVEVEHV